MERLLSLIPTGDLVAFFNPLALAAAAITAVIVFSGLAARLSDNLEQLIFKMQMAQSDVPAALLNRKQHHEPRHLRSLDRTGDLLTSPRAAGANPLPAGLVA